MSKREEERKREQERERRWKLVTLKNRLLFQIEATKALFLAEGCEDDHEGSAFDCWVLDQFNGLLDDVREKFYLKQVRKKMKKA